ncbi:MAG: nitrile hydratase accessory protein [Gemmatimonadetes bacterium]|nr:nitrile hydratase accessory protein [Gemmatimonadota bacterium]
MDTPLEDIPLGDIPLGDDGSPVFAAPWEASAFAIAVRLSGEGHFTWSEWAATLSEEIRAAQQEGDPDLGDTYYKHWLRALERLCIAHGLVSQEEASDRKDAWQKAYLDTPHGKPVELATDHQLESPA